MRLKYKNNKLQFGGVIGGGSYTVPIISDLPETYTGAGSLLLDPDNVFIPQKPTVDRNKFKPDLSEFFKDIKGKGHTNEVNQIQKMKEKLDAEMNSLSDLDILSGTNKFYKVLQGYNQLTSPGLINQLINSKERTDESFKIANQKKNLSQIHIKEGKVKVLKDGKLVEIDPINAVKLYRKGEIKIPTNAKLWQERDTNPNLAHNYNLSQELTYGVNIDEVIDKWRKNFASLGSTENGGRFKQAIDIVSQGIATGNTLLAQDIMRGYKHDDNFAQVRAALEMSKRAMSQEELDSLTSFAIGRILSLGLEPTPENIEEQMLKALINLAETKVDSSDWSESDIGKVDITDMGKISMGGGSGGTPAPVNFYENAYNGRGTKRTLRIMDASEGTAGSKIEVVGQDLGNTFDKDSKGNNEYTLLSSNGVLRGRTPLIGTNIGTTLTGKEVKADEVVPLEDGVLTFALKDANGKVVATYDSVKKAEENNGKGYTIVPVIAIKAALVNKPVSDSWFADGVYDDEIEKGQALKINDDKLKTKLSKVFNLVEKVDGKEQEGREYAKGEDIVSTVVYFDASAPTVWRNADKHDQLYPRSEAFIQNQVNNVSGSNYGETNATYNRKVSPVLIPPVE